MIEYYAKSKKENKIEKIEKPIKGCWINVVDPSQEEINFLSKEFCIDCEEINDALDIHETPRVDSEDDVIYIHSTVPTEILSQDYDSSFLIAISKNYFFSISKNPLEIITSALNQKREVKHFSNSRNLFRILFLISRVFETSVGTISKEIKLNKLDLSELGTKDLEKLIKYEDKLTSYTSSFGATIHVYHKLLREKSINFSEEDKGEIEDLIVDLNETLVLCNEALKSISNMRNYYHAKLSNDLNKTVLTLTIVTIFISIPTLIGSIYGMNIHLPYQEKEYFIYILMGIMIFIWGLMFFGLKKFKII